MFTKRVTKLSSIVAYCNQPARYTTVAYVIQPPTQRCARGSELTNIQECIAAQKHFGQQTAKIKVEYVANAPPFCSRYQSDWFFNLDEAGTLDGGSEPVCETAGEMCGHLWTKNRELFCP